MNVKIIMVATILYLLAFSHITEIVQGTDAE